MKILGISAFYHDSAAAIIEDGRIIAAAQEERFTRKKHDAGFPLNAIRFCLEYSGVTIDELDAVAFYDKPLLKFERIIETYYAFAPKGISSFIASMPIWLKEKMFLKKVIRDELKKISDYDRKKLKLLFPEHHLSHAASAFYPSRFEHAAILTIDGVGEFATASIGYGEGKDITIHKELQFPHSLGLLYSAFTYFLGFKVNSGEYKLMGLAPYGNPDADEVKKFNDIIKRKLIEIKEDGSLWLNQEYFSYATGLRMVHDDTWENLFGFPRRGYETPLEQHHCNLASAIQQITEEVVIKMAQEAKRVTGSDYLCMAGGVALNCVANGKLLNTKIFKDIFIQPAAGDAGGAPGAALAAYHIYFGRPRVVTKEMDDLQGSYLGPEFSDSDVKTLGEKYNAPYKYFENFDELCIEVANYIEEGAAIGWVQGRMEFGPRALGARSIIADARNPGMQQKLNQKIKYRESFRPFAPSVLIDDSKKYFDHEGSSPYMTMVQQLVESRKKKLPDGFNNFHLKDKLNYIRSDIPAVTHVDFSTRMQTVHKKTTPRYWKLIDAFKKKSGYGVILNTSFNVRGEPIVCTAEDAYRCFMQMEMEYLVIGNFLFLKKDQPAWKNIDNPKKEKINRAEKLKALLVIVTGLAVVGFLSKKNAWFYAAGIVGVVTLTIPFAGYWTVWLWYKISEVIGWFMSRVILSLIFFLFLYPISWFVKKSFKNMLLLKRVKEKTVFTERNHKYVKEDLENTW